VLREVVPSGECSLDGDDILRSHGIRDEIDARDLRTFDVIRNAGIRDTDSSDRGECHA
jgi:hypothetical protein